MIYDSIRQAKPSIRNNFGAGRLNTRVSFYFFEANRLSFTQGKSGHLKRFYNYTVKDPRRDFLLYLGTLDSTLFSYVFHTSTYNSKVYRDILEGKKPSKSDLAALTSTLTSTIIRGKPSKTKPLKTLKPITNSKLTDLLTDLYQKGKTKIADLYQKGKTKLAELKNPKGDDKKKNK